MASRLLVQLVLLPNIITMRFVAVFAGGVPENAAEVVVLVPSSQDMEASESQRQVRCRLLVAIESSAASNYAYSISCRECRRLPCCTQRSRCQPKSPVTPDADAHAGCRLDGTPASSFCQANMLMLVLSPAMPGGGTGAAERAAAGGAGAGAWLLGRPLRRRAPPRHQGVPYTFSLDMCLMKREIETMPPDAPADPLTSRTVPA